MPQNSNSYVVFTKPNCPFCDRAKRLLEEKEEIYDEREIGKDISLELFARAWPHIRSVPAIFVLSDGPLTEDGIQMGNMDYVGGYDQLKRRLDDEQKK